MGDLQTALDALGRGDIIVITGDRLRGGDIDFCTPASMITPDKINFMARYGRGLICLTMTSERAVSLGIALMNPTAHNQTGRPFGNSIEATDGITTGISAADRARTVEMAVKPGATAGDLVSPGHVFPLIARTEGTSVRMSAVEGSIELCRLAGVGDAAVICSIMRDDGEMARLNDIEEMIDEHGLTVANIGDITT
ncbi:3,4-dihydroxy-2-butanone-4-phosphate synthase [Novosphingopyxis sp. YJ-S2-01]|uniref:3,4-dihydroxy-2-butanone-4-phosphate synthase n=1 Tax=Novosphingopyxis sp. YJ-S2-01 TaxID=2794021 RepID=UPI0018DCAD72|nr:3,4-dihydroxy-2-butanone-4-phosphate synthase [Novosphingopyxis sp. YJ-S2-01]MBH9537746.1 3,4-dihydroxy-2-butanone-4-phosphate synthase [Novosphingopyxis sp. YJ-S2-01]